MPSIFLSGWEVTPENVVKKVIFWLRDDGRRSADGQLGVPGFMVDLYLYKKLGVGAEGLVRCGLQSIRQKDLSVRPGCINRVLRSTLR